MQSRPDSALCILQGISMDKFATQADSACYALLLTQARDKNYVVQTDDSLIRYAVAYYDKRMMCACRQRHIIIGDVCIGI